jgi:hypothetical protein
VVRTRAESSTAIPSSPTIASAARAFYRALDLAPRVPAAKARPRGVECDVEGAVVGSWVALGRERGRVELRLQALAVGIVDVDHGAVGPFGDEQPPLGLKVVLHVSVEVEVVLGQVRKRRHREPDSIAAPQRERVRGDLHRAGPVAAVDHAAEGGLDVDRLRGRALDLLLDPADHPLHGAEQAGLDSRGLEQVANQECRGGLPVRARDSDHLQLRGGVATEAHRGVGHRRTRVGNDGLGHGHLELQHSLDHQRRGAGLDRERREGVSVGRLAGHAEEQRPWTDSATVVGEPVNFDVRVALDLDDVGTREQLS